MHDKKLGALTSRVRVKSDSKRSAITNKPLQCHVSLIIIHNKRFKKVIKVCYCYRLHFNAFQTLFKQSKENNYKELKPGSHYNHASIILWNKARDRRTCIENSDKAKTQCHRLIDNGKAKLQC